MQSDKHVFKECYFVQHLDNSTVAFVSYFNTFIHLDQIKLNKYHT